METLGNFQKLSGFQLKIIALLCMTIDHAAIVFIPSTTALYTAMRVIGRQAFPIYCFLLAEGDHYTHSHAKYALRLFVFALLSEIPFDLALHNSFFYPQKQNVFWTLLAAELVLWGIAKLKERSRTGKHKVLTCGLNGWGWVGTVVISCIGFLTVRIFKTDYSATGVFLIIMLSLMREQGLFGLLICAVAAAGCWYDSTLQMTALFSFILIALYNGQRGQTLPKNLFYTYYPAHLAVFAAVAGIVGR